MKNLIIIFLFYSVQAFAQSDNLMSGHDNVIIGENAGMNITTESYCTIIGNDSIAQNIHGANFIWYIDFNCEYLHLKPELKGYLKAIEKYFLKDNSLVDKIRKIIEIHEDIKKFI